MLQNWSKIISTSLLLMFICLIVTGRYQILITEIETFFRETLTTIDSSTIRILENFICIVLTASFKNIDQCLDFIDQNMRVHLEVDVSIFFFFIILFSWCIKSHFSKS